MMTDAEKRAYADRMMKVAQTPKETVDDLYSMGMLNEIILGAIRVTLENLDYKQTDISEVLHECQRGTFDLYMASQLRNAFKERGINYDGRA